MYRMHTFHYKCVLLIIIIIVTTYQQKLCVCGISSLGSACIISKWHGHENLAKFARLFYPTISQCLKSTVIVLFAAHATSSK